jgi:AcrR family transcriptional regulator
MIGEIKASARAHLATDGANLSLRAVARDLGMVSSAVYRYFPSRDDLLTALIVDAYNDLGDAAEQAEATVDRTDLTGRFLALVRAVRTWALAHPHEYALIYGSPVPGYAAPQDTIEPALRPVVVLAGIARDGCATGAIVAPDDDLAPEVRADFAAIGQDPRFAGVPQSLLARGMTARIQLFGLLSLELFGHFTASVQAREAFFEHQMRTVADHLCLPPPAQPPSGARS